MMIIKTKYHGETQIQEDQTIMFKNGLPGFTGEKKFVILPLSEDSPFVVLQSVQSEELAFIVASPFVFFKIMALILMKRRLNFLKSNLPKTLK